MLWHHAFPRPSKVLLPQLQHVYATKKPKLVLLSHYYREYYFAYEQALSREESPGYVVAQQFGTPRLY